LEGWIAEPVSQPVPDLLGRDTFGTAADDKVARGCRSVRPCPCLTEKHRGRGQEATDSGGDLGRLERSPAQLADSVCKVRNGDDGVCEHHRLDRAAAE